MSWRYPLVSGIRILGRVLEEMAIGLAIPDDLIRLNKRFFNNEASKSVYLADPTLFPPEEEFVEASGLRTGRVLVIGCGSGRDTIALAKRGFTVTAIDQVPTLVDATRLNAAKAEVSVEVYCAEVSSTTWPPATFDLIFLPNLMYTYIPTRRRRIQTLERLRTAAKPGGWCYLRFLCTESSSTQARRFLHLMQRMVAWSTLGNVECELGDTLDRGLFEHRFSDSKVVEDEAQMAGWIVQRSGEPNQNIDYLWITAPSKVPVLPSLR